MKRLAAASLLVLCACAPIRAAAGEGAHPVDRLEPRHWLEAPDSQMNKVAFQWPAGVKHGSIGGIMAAWSGGVYDTKRDRLVIWGGGHGDYAGNEIYAFDVKQLKWERATDPTLDTDPEGKLERTGVYADGNPRSCHTYGYLEYVPGIDRLCAFGVGATWPMAWSMNPESLVAWAFDFEAKKWEKKSRVPWRVHASALDPVTGRVWVRSRFAAYVAEWDPAKDVWTVRSKQLPWDGNFLVSGVVDPVGRQFLALGGKFFFAYDIAADGMLSQEEIKATGPQDVVNVRMGPGADYDPVADKLVCWNGGSDVYTMDLASRTWEKIPAAADNRATPGAPCKAGTWGRWRYVPSKNAYVVVSAVDQSVFFYRLTRREEQPIPARFIEALKKGDAALVGWVAGEVAKWPKERAGPILKGALAGRSGAGAEAVRKALEGLQ